MTISLTRWAALGAALAVAVGSGTFALVTADSGTPSSFVPITPCRLIDTRATSPVGPRSTPILAGESLTVQVTGSNGQCVIPASATAIVINVTAVGPTAAGYISLYPADVGLPNASNLNFTANQNPTPNLVTVSLSSGGAIKIFNVAGNVNVLGDIAGYYQPDAATGNAGAACTADGLPGVIVNGYDHEHNVSSKCFTRLVTTLAGNGSFVFADGVGFMAGFDSPRGVAVDSVGNIYVADTLHNSIRKITFTGVVITLASGFNFPTGIAVDQVGNVYVADSFNHRIRKITPAGVVSILAGNGAAGGANGNGVAAQFSSPHGVAVDNAGNVYVGDYGNHRIRKIAPNGDVTTLAGSGPGFADGPGGTALFLSPRGVAADNDGNVYVADGGNHMIRKIAPNGDVTTLAGNLTSGSADGTGGAAGFNAPFGVSVDADGNVYVADYGNHRIRKVTAAGVVTTIAGSVNGFADGVGAAAEFNLPQDLAVDSSGTIYVADTNNNRIRQIK